MEPTAAPSSAPPPPSIGVQAPSQNESKEESKNVVIEALGDVQCGGDDNNADNVLKSMHSGQRTAQSLRFLVDTASSSFLTENAKLVLCYVDPRGKLHHYYTFDDKMDHDEGTYTGDAFVAYHSEENNNIKPATIQELIENSKYKILCSYRLKLALDKKYIHCVDCRVDKDGKTTVKVSAMLKQDDEYRICIGLEKKLCRLPPPNTSWQVEYEYVCPPLPITSTPTTTTTTWNSKHHTFYIWGDLDFDDYGNSHFVNVPCYLRAIHPCRMNQIVPQLMIGNCLALNDATTYKPKWVQFDEWVIQAQYYWQASKDNSRAYCGRYVNVSPGNVICTKIQYKASDGSMHVSIAVVEENGIESKEKKSEIVIPQPFMHDPSLFENWNDFFTKCVQAEQHQHEKESNTKSQRISNKANSTPTSSLRGAAAEATNNNNKIPMGPMARPCLNVEYKGRVDIKTLKAVCPFVVIKASYPNLPEDYDISKWKTRFYCPRTGNTSVLKNVENKDSLAIENAIKLGY